MGLITEDVRTGKTSEGPGLGRPTRRERTDEDAPYSSEITLGMRSMLAIFFGLVLVCGVFFGLGYSVGRNGGLRPATDDTASSPAIGDSSLKKPSATDQGLTPVPAQSASTNSDQSKPAQNSNTVTETDLGSKPVSDETAKPAATPAPAAQTPVAASQLAPTKPASSQPVAQKPAFTPAPQTAAQKPNPAPPAKPAESFSNPYRPVTPQPAAQSYTQSSASPAAGGFMVQIAAVRQPQDANVLVSALQQHGFHAQIRHEAQDQLLHIQLGPFATRAEAYDMRSKLLANGYNAVVK
ncbi:MAG TPA: SPOR domain-containing protein [Acidobacteriaceae bacterium]|nr:SPOR domain-containing protein [Acidobacteriaceae bacterium]